MFRDGKGGACHRHPAENGDFKQRLPSFLETCVMFATRGVLIE